MRGNCRYGNLFFDFSSTHDCLKTTCILMTWEPGNTGTPAMFSVWKLGNTGTPAMLNIWEPGNTGTPTILNIWEPGNTGTPYLKAPCCLGTFREKSIWGTCSWKMNMVTLEIMSKQAILSKWLPRPNHYAHKICIEILCRTPVSILKYLSPRPQKHMKNSKYSFLA